MDYTPDNTVTVPSGGSTPVHLRSDIRTTSTRRRRTSRSRSPDPVRAISTTAPASARSPTTTPRRRSRSPARDSRGRRGPATYNVVISGASAPVSVGYRVGTATVCRRGDFTRCRHVALTWAARDTATKSITRNTTNDSLDENRRELRGHPGRARTASPSRTAASRRRSPTTTTRRRRARSPTVSPPRATPATTSSTSRSTCRRRAGSRSPSSTRRSTAPRRTQTTTTSPRSATRSSIPAGQTTGTIGITINGDTVPEPNESFTVNLNSATNATLGADTQATGTITNDDSGVTASINDVTADRGEHRHDELRLHGHALGPGAVRRRGHMADGRQIGRLAGSDYTGAAKRS